MIGVLTLLALLFVKLREFEFLGTLRSGRLELAMEGGKSMVIESLLLILLWGEWKLDENIFLLNCC